MIDFSPDNVTSNNPVILSEEAKMPIAKFALCFFQNENKVQGVTHHAITDNKLEIGRYIDQGEVIDWLTELSSHREFNPKTEWVSEHVLVDTPNTFVFFQRSFVDRMWFRTRERHFAIRVPYPAMLYKVNRLRRDLSVWALDRDSRPSLKSRLFHAPIMNIGCSGELCQGTAPIPEVLTNDCSQEVVDALIKSNFSHVNHSATLRIDGVTNVTNEIYIKFFESLQGSVDFPSKHLVPINQSIESILK